MTEEQLRELQQLWREINESMQRSLENLREANRLLEGK